MAGSLVLSLTVIPALSSLLLRSRGEHEALMFRVLRPAYARALDVALRGRVVVLALAGALLVASVAAFPLLGTEFVPTLEEGSMMYRITNIPSASLKNVLASVKGAKDVQVETLLGKPTVTLQVDRAAAARFGLNVADVLEVVRAGIGGEVVSTIIDGPRRYEVVVRFDEASRRDVADILRIPVRTSEGNIVPLSRVAEAVVTSGVAKVRRESLSRLIVVQANVEGRDVGGFVAEAQERIAKAVKFPPGYYTDWGGAFENQRRAMRTLSIIVPLTIALILVLLYTAFQSMRHALLIISGVPFSVVGGILALLLSGQNLSVPAAIGFIAVFGVAMLNGVVLVAYLVQLREEGRPLLEVVREGCGLRLRPVLMTATVTILGLVPLLIARGIGAEVQRPLATVVVGGLFTSTLLTLFVLPIL
jgi:cobalt-zinc-cadmium resistance protein CzcA